MHEPVLRDDAPDESPADSTGFDDPALEAAFGFLSPDGWIQRAHESVSAIPAPGRLGPYELLEEIGRGGQGVVFRAVQPGTGRIIAIKRLSTPHLTGTRHRARFEQETRALVRLHHPSIVTVHGAEEVEGSPILVMEHVEGEPIDRWADRQGASAAHPHATVLAAFAQVCDAVAHAHQRGVIHRDLKPSNVLVDESGVPRVLDFGIARLADELQARAAEAATFTVFAGTPAYASPEQLENAPDSDTRTDVYSLGALLYRLLTGGEAFSRELSLPKLIDAVRAGAVRRPSLVRPGVPAELDWVVLKAIHRDPALRYQTVDALSADVRRFLRGRPVTAHPPSRVYAAAKFVGRNKLPCAAAGTALLLIIALTAVSIAQAVRVSSQNRSLVLAVESEVKARQAANAQTAAQRAITEAVSDAATEVANWMRLSPLMTGAQMLAFFEAELTRLPEPADPLSRAQFHALRAQFAGAAGRHEESADHWVSAVALAEGVYDPAGPRLARLRRSCALALLLVDRREEALVHANGALAVTAPEERTPGYELLCRVHVARRDFPAAAAAVESLLREPPLNPAHRAWALDVAARVKQSQGRDREARALFEEELSVLLAAGRDGGFDAARTRVYIALLLLKEGKADEAEPYAAAAADVRLKRNGPMFARTQDALLTHAEALARLGRFTESAERIEQALPRMAEAYGRDSRKVAMGRFRLAAAYLGAGDRAGGRRNLALAISLGATSDPDAPAVASDVDLSEIAVTSNACQVNHELSTLPGPLAWLAESALPVFGPFHGTDSDGPGVASRWP